jgi:hypothetical protein
MKGGNKMAVKCANCDNDAIYTSGDPGVNPVNYCNLCLPSWMTNRAAAGHFPLFDPEVKESKKEVKEKVVEEEVTEESEDDNV